MEMKAKVTISIAWPKFRKLQVGIEQTYDEFWTVLYDHPLYSRERTYDYLHNLRCLNFKTPNAPVGPPYKLQRSFRAHRFQTLPHLRSQTFKPCFRFAAGTKPITRNAR
jgi:hypothetical protein